MQSLESLKRLVDSAGDLRAIVRTMKALAAVSIRQYERAVASLADYDRTVQLGLRALLRQADVELEAAGAGPACLVAFGSDQGMCGQFNEQVAAFAAPVLEALAPRGERRLIVVGSRLADRLAEAGHSADELLGVPASATGMNAAAQEILLAVDRARRGGAGRVELCHHRPRGASGSQLHRLQLLPLPRERLAELRAGPWPTRTLPMWTAEPGRLFSSLAQQLIFVAVYRALAESLASECAARLASMQAAEKNIGERLEALQASYHQQRQTAVTAELLDIVSGFEALLAVR